MKNIILAILLIATISVSAQQENKLLNFYKSYYNLSFSNEDVEQNQKFTELYNTNTFDVDFKKAIYAIFINNQIANDRDVSYKAFVLLQLLEYEKLLDVPLYKQKGKELHNNLNVVKDNANIEIAKLHLYKGKKPKLKDKILYSEEEYNQAKEYIVKYFLKK